MKAFTFSQRIAVQSYSTYHTPMDAAYRFRAATLEDLEQLSRIAFDSKAYWGYPEAWMQAWRPLLTIGSNDLDELHIEVLEASGEPCGFFALTRSQPTTELMHMWLEPRQIGRGAGRLLAERLCECAAALGAESIELDADLHATSFYEHLGASQIGKTPAAMPGAPDRYLPRMLLRLDA